MLTIALDQSRVALPLEQVAYIL